MGCVYNGGGGGGSAHKPSGFKAGNCKAGNIVLGCLGNGVQVKGRLRGPNGKIAETL